MVAVYRYISLDDEPAAHRVLRRLLSDHAQFADAGAFDDPESARTCLKAKRADLLFLDIEMPQCTGLKFLQSLANPPPTILVTAHAEFALKAFELGVRDYLLKPVSADRIGQCLDRVLPILEEARRIGDSGISPALAFKSGHATIFLSPEAIVAVDADGNFSHLITSEREIHISEPLKSLEERLAPFGIVRCHKSHLINIAAVKKLCTSSMQLSAAISRPVGRAYRSLLVNRLAC